MVVRLYGGRKLTKAMVLFILVGFTHTHRIEEERVHESFAVAHRVESNAEEAHAHFEQAHDHARVQVERKERDRQHAEQREEAVEG